MLQTFSQFFFITLTEHKRYQSLTGKGQATNDVNSIHNKWKGINNIGNSSADLVLKQQITMESWSSDALAIKRKYIRPSNIL